MSPEFCSSETILCSLLNSQSSAPNVCHDTSNRAHLPTWYRVLARLFTINPWTYYPDHPSHHHGPSHNFGLVPRPNHQADFKFSSGKNPQTPWPQTRSPTRVSFENLNGPYSWPPLCGRILRMEPEKVAKRPTGIDRSV